MATEANVLSLDDTLKTLRWAVEGGGFEDAAQTEAVSRAALHHLAEVERLREALGHARSGLEYVLDHEAIGDRKTCICAAAKSVAEASLRLSDPATDESGYGVHTCYADCPCHRGEQPLPDFIEAGNTGSATDESERDRHA